MTTPTKDPRPSGPPTLQCQTSNPPEYKPNWKVIVPVALISAAVLLVCLPVGALLIVNSTGCCTVNGPENVVTFWATMIAGFLALFGMLITGVFVITSLRVEATARAQAQIEAREEVWKYIRRYQSELVEQITALVSEMQKEGEEAKGEITAAREEVTAQQSGASRAIASAQREITSTAAEARRAIAGARNETTDAARQAQEAVNGARSQTTDAARQAQEAIDGARQEVETAAQAARDRIDRTGDSPQGGDESQ